MKKHFVLAIRFTFYIAALIFFDNNIRVIPAILLISVLFLDNPYYSILPLSLCFLSDPIIIVILIATLLYHILLYPFIRKNRYYALSVYLLSLFTANILLLISKTYTLDVLYLTLVSIILYGVINAFYVFYNKGNKYSIISLNDKLIHLTLLLGYLLLITLYNPKDLLYFLLFMQFYIIGDIKYSITFFLLSISVYAVRYRQLQTESLSYLASSFVPPVLLVRLDFTKTATYLYSLYAILLTLLKLKPKKITIETDCISTLFDDFKKYIQDLNREYDKLNTIKELKEKHLESIQSSFCASCKENTVCRYKADKRYSFLCNAMGDENGNIYGCPHYKEFYLNTNTETGVSYLQFNAITNLADELEYLYAQNIKMAKCYNRFICDLNFYDYKIEKVDMNLAAPTIYFSLTLTKDKQIIRDIFLKLSYKAFREILDLKIIENETNYIVYIYKKPKVKLEYSHKILAKNNNLISGDNYYIKKDYNESYTFALSDGMGSGHTAYKESSEALKLISHLSTYHFSSKTILKLLENIYDLKCEYDSYATLDLLNINTSNMKLNLYKLGSTTSYIYHNRELRAFENKALPLKLDDINSSYEVEYFKDDVILLFSDGISDFLTPLEIKNEVDFTRSTDEIMNHILNKLKKKENNELKDDASIIVIKVV